MSHMKQALMEVVEGWTRDIQNELGDRDEAFYIYLNNIHQPVDDLWRNFLEEFEDSYAGHFDTRTDFVDSILEDVLGISQANSVRDNEIKFLITYFDREKYGRDLMHDYWETDGHYFRSY